jgi:hypothetical protein
VVRRWISSSRSPSRKFSDPTVHFPLFRVLSTDICSFFSVCAIAQVVYGSIIVHRVRKGVYNNDRNVEDGGHGLVTYESAENGIKMNSAPVPQYR